MTADVLVTGAAGFIASAVVRRLRDDGKNVVGVDVRLGPEVDQRFDVTDERTVREAFETHRPSVVVHAAAIVDDRGDPALFEEVNVRGTGRVLAAARASGCKRFVHLSSIAALGVAPTGRCDSRTPPVDDTGSPYFDTKARSERLVRSHFGDQGMEVVVIRPGDVYGPGSVPWVERALKLMRQRQPVLVAGGRGLMAHCHVENLVDAIKLATTHPDAPGGVFIIHDGSDGTTFGEYFGRLADAAGLKRPSVSLPVHAAYALADVTTLLHQVGGPQPPFTKSMVDYLARQSTYSIDEARTALGYEPRISLDDGMNSLASLLR